MSGKSSDVVIVLDDEHDQTHNPVHDEDESIIVSQTDQQLRMTNHNNDHDDDDELRKKNKRSNSWHKLGRCDSLEVESSKVGNNHHHRHGHAGCKEVDWSTILYLAFQSIGVIYGDIGTSPLYVYASTFTDGIKHNDDILGVLSLILYTITLIPVIKYIFIVLRATDNGE
ncbi:hypothetical protein MKX01_032044, partial [Papaver californicum]